VASICIKVPLLILIACGQIEAAYPGQDIQYEDFMKKG